MVARGHRLPSDRSFAQDAIIREFFERDPDYVFRLIAEIAERLKADGRYKQEEVEAAIAVARQSACFIDPSRERGWGPPQPTPSASLKPAVN